MRAGALPLRVGFMLRLAVVRLDPDLPLPVSARMGDAGMDLHARTAVELAPAGGRAVVGTGIALGLEDGWCGLVLARSGLAARHGVTVVNAPGLIDAGYRGEVMVALVNLDPHVSHLIKRGDRIAQLMVQRVTCVEWEVLPVLSASDRGSGGFGHSGC